MEQVKGSDEVSTGTRFLREHNIAYNETDASYYQAKVEAIESGETVWMRRNFESAAALLSIYGLKENLRCVSIISKALRMYMRLMKLQTLIQRGHS